MAVAIESFGVSTVDIFGFSPPLVTGFSDQIGSPDTVTNGDLSIFGGQNLRALLWQNSTGLLNLEVYGCHENGGFDYINFNGLTFNRTAATYSVIYNTSATASQKYSEGGVWTTWSWSRSTNPFSTATTETVTFYHNGSVPAYGDITMNEIHQEAGGSSGTSVTINDSDVRAKSWYATVAGSTPASGATNRMGDYYWPTHIPENQDDQKRRLLGTTHNSVDYKIGHAEAEIVNARINAVYQQAKCGMTIETDGTDTIIRYRLFAVNNHEGTADSQTTSLLYWDDTGSGTSNSITYNSLANEAIIFPGVVVSEAALLTSVVSESITTATNSNGTSIGGSSSRVSGFGETLMSTNSITSFVSITPNSTQYGCSFDVDHTINPNTTTNNLTSNRTIRFRWALRAKPQTHSTDVAKCYLLKDTTLNYLFTIEVRGNKAL